MHHPRLRSRLGKRMLQDGRYICQRFLDYCSLVISICDQSLSTASAQATTSSGSGPVRDLQRINEKRKWASNFTESKAHASNRCSLEVETISQNGSTAARGTSHSTRLDVAGESPINPATVYIRDGNGMDVQRGNILRMRIETESPA